MAVLGPAHTLHPVTVLTFPEEGVGTLEFEGSFSDQTGPTPAAGVVEVPSGIEVALNVSGPMAWRPSSSAYSSTLTITHDGEAGVTREPTSTSWEGHGVAGDHFVDLGFLRDLPPDCLTSLSMNATVDGSTFGAVAHLAPGLRRLTLAWSDLDDAVVPSIAALTGLTYLQTFGNRFTDQGVQQLSALVNLESLYLEEETLSAMAFAFAASLPRLSRLGLQDVLLSEEQLAALRGAMPGVRVE